MIEQLEQQFVSDDLVRIKAWDHFQELGLPSKQMEVWRYVKLRKLYEKEFTLATTSVVTEEQIRPFILPGFEDSKLVFVNGFFQPDLSTCDQIEVSTINEARKTFGSFLNTHLAKLLKEETDPFAVLNGAMSEQGAFIYLPPKRVVEKPIQVLFLTDGEQQMMFPRLHGFFGAHSEVNFITTQGKLSGDHNFINQFSDFVVEEGAKVKWHQGNFSFSGDWFFDAMRVELKQNSSFYSMDATNGSATVRKDYKISLKGENGEVFLNGIWKLDGKCETHTNVLIDHYAPHCRSMQLFKGVLADQSRSSFEGKIMVRQEAQKTDAFQLNNNLLLSDLANADCKPNLEIFADDVKASHGATFGQLDKEQLFYLKSRGYASDVAKNLLVRGFVHEVVDQITLTPFKTWIEQELWKRH